ncbi:MAG: tetratricopeptide (TPR) repeat protein [Candidatus Azotimanducaceae bacterium]|jgi:tetratricopeptide (TPR) repeat protein
MKIFGPNTLRNKAKTAKSVSLIIITAMTAIFAANNVLANEDALPLQMVVVVDQAKGKAVLKGHYENAVAYLTKKDADYFAQSTNLCVAYTKLQEFDQATISCDKAVELGGLKAEKSNRSNQRTRNREFALALSNKGVLLAISGKTEGAAREFERAIALDTSLREPGKNLSALMKTTSS